MKYLDALKVVQYKKKLTNKTLKLYSSSFTDPLDIFIKAFFIKKKINIKIERNSFNTLTQSLINDNLKTQKIDFVIIILYPWDFVGDLDWRTGINYKNKLYNQLSGKINNFSNLISRIDKSNLSILYFDFPIPQTLININENLKLKHFLNFNAKKYTKVIHNKELFDLEKYIDIGCPFYSPKLSSVASFIVSSCSKKNRLERSLKPYFKNIVKNYDSKSKKIIATDFDGVLWNGVIGEDGPKGINCSTDVLGYKHNFYQDLLLKLKNEGILIIGITKNTTSDANLGLKNINCKIKKKDFVKIFASYNPKSSQLKSALKSLNLLEEHLLFVDDNDVEIAEVKKNLPKSTCIKFPKNFDEYSKFINKINLLFSKNTISQEDKNRTSNYKAILKTTKILKDKSKNIDSYLNSLDMCLQIEKKGLSNISRAAQLINKTNQFNINGVRLSEKKILNIISNKGNLYTGFYKDNTGDYGEIIALLSDQQGNIISFVMSCRVFQRNIEHVFLYELLKKKSMIKKFKYLKTDKNQPIYNFLFNEMSKFIDLNKNFKNKKKYFDFYKKKYKLFNIKYS